MGVIKNEFPYNLEKFLSEFKFVDHQSNGFPPQFNFESNVRPINPVIPMYSMQVSKILAQANSSVREPRVPVYFVFPHHKDNMNAFCK